MKKAPGDMLGAFVVVLCVFFGDVVMRPFTAYAAIFTCAPLLTLVTVSPPRRGDGV